MDQQKISLVYAQATVVLIVLFIIPTALLNSFIGYDNFWEFWQLGPAGLYEEFCERNRMESFLREPVNSWSNYAFVWFGLVCLFMSFHDSKSTSATSNLLVLNPVLSVFSGLSFISLGIGSFLYHASLSKVMQRWDMAGTYAAMIAIVIIGMIYLFVLMRKEQKKHYNKAHVVLFLCLGLATDYLMYRFKWQIDSTIAMLTLIGLMVLAILIIEFYFKVHGKLNFALWAMTSMVVAYAIWILDVKKILCAPNSIIQGHAIWHILTGLSLFLMYRYYRSIDVSKAKQYGK